LVLHPFCLIFLPQPVSLVKTIHTGIGTLMAVSSSQSLQANPCVTFKCTGGQRRQCELRRARRSLRVHRRFS
jgi:hypothetical protein